MVQIYIPMHTPRCPMEYTLQYLAIELFSGRPSQWPTRIEYSLLDHFDHPPHIHPKLAPFRDLVWPDPGLKWPLGPRSWSGNRGCSWSRSWIRSKIRIQQPTRPDPGVNWSAGCWSWIWLQISCLWIFPMVHDGILALFKMVQYLLTRCLHMASCSAYGLAGPRYQRLYRNQPWLVLQSGNPFLPSFSALWGQWNQCGEAVEIGAIFVCPCLYWSNMAPLPQLEKSRFSLGLPFQMSPHVIDHLSFLPICSLFMVSD